MSSLACIQKIGPGILVALGITIAAQGLVHLQRLVFGFEFVDSLVFAIILGTLYHTLFGLKTRFKPGVEFSAKFILELAIVLLGVSISVATVADAGTAMIALVAAIVFLSLVISYSICRLMGLTDQLATLVACGNSICGNSAIVAAAPVIGAKSDDVAASIAFTAALGIVFVLLLPVLFSTSSFNEWQYGVFAGMTVYAVPQVLAATAPIGVASVQIGTLVKLMRVLMLGPVVLLLRLKGRGDGALTGLPLARLVPWFIIGFFVMMGLRSLDLVPAFGVDLAKAGSTLLTTVSMAALGLSVNLRTVLASGGRVLMSGVLSLVALSMLSLGGIAILHLQ